jgi:serine/threonine-protein kinase
LHLTPNLVVAERFRLISPLGQGGMGAIWLAHHVGLGILCAVKFIHDHAALSPEIRARFELEAHAVAQIRSPHVVQIFDHGVWEDTPYIAMEYLQGEDLGKRLQRRRVLTPAETVSILSQIGHAMAKAHAVGLVHRDLKPANIFLARDDEAEIAKVLDFGIAKDVSPGVDPNTITGEMLGTPSYMSPEQGRGNKNLDHRSDLWAVGVIAYRCLTGQLPFKAEVLGDLLMKIMVDPLPVPSTVAPVPPGFDAWWIRAMAREPEQRYQSMKELVEALRVALDTTLPPAPETPLPSAAASPAYKPVHRTINMAAPLPEPGAAALVTPSFAGAMNTPSFAAAATELPPSPLSSAPPRPGDLSTVTYPTAWTGNAAAIPSLPPPAGSVARSASGPIGAVVTAALVVGLLGLGGAGAFFALRGRSEQKAGEPSRSQVAPPPAPSASTAVAISLVVPEPTAEAVVTAESALPAVPRPAPLASATGTVATSAPRPPSTRPTPVVAAPPPTAKKHEGIY